MCDIKRNARLFNLLLAVSLIANVACGSPTTKSIDHDGVKSAVVVVVVKRDIGRSRDIENDDSRLQDGMGEGWDQLADYKPSGSDDNERNADVEETIGFPINLEEYRNEFNMPAEASIPEDILDQEHIEDGNIDSNDDDDDDAATDAYGMQYEEEDSGAADIIFESQRSSSKNLNSYDGADTVRSSSSSNGSGSSGRKNKGNNKYKNLFNKLKAKKQNSNDGDDKARDNKGNDEFYSLAMTNKGLHRELYKKEPVKAKASRKNENDNPNEEGVGDDEWRMVGSIDEINKRKFNKASTEPKRNDEMANKTGSSSSINSNNNNREKHNSLNGDDNDSVKDTKQNSKDINDDENENFGETAIGDIIENFHSNEDEAEAEDEDGGLFDVDEAKTTARTEETETEKGAEAETTLKSEPKQDEAKNIASPIERGKSTVSETKTKEAVREKLRTGFNKAASPSEFIARKSKRYDSMRSRAGAFDMHSTGPSDNDKDKDNGGYSRMGYSDETSANNVRMQQHQQYVDAAKSFVSSSEQKDYSINSFGIVANGSNPSGDTESSENGEDKNSSLRRARNRYEASAAAAAATAAAGPGNAVKPDDSRSEVAAASHRAQSAFEYHKEQRRNKKRYGHRTHKKKYKDYQRHAVTTIATTTKPTTTTTTTATPPSPDERAQSKDEIVGGVENVNGYGKRNVTTAKMTNVTREDYEKQWQTQERMLEKLKKHAKKMKAEKMKGLPAPPIFSIGGRSMGPAAVNEPSSKPFYEGQINYYLETKDDDDDNGDSDGENDGRIGGAGELSDGSDGKQLRSQHDSRTSDNWYRHVSPVLRNAIKTNSFDGRLEHHERRRYPYRQRPSIGLAQATSTSHQHHSHHNHQHSTHHHHHHHQEEQHRNHRDHHHHHQQHHKHDKQQSSPRHQQHKSPYQRKLLPNRPSLTSSLTAHALGDTDNRKSTISQTPYPPPSYRHHTAGAMQELGHQITEMEDLERYYAKWPHLARVQFQVYDEHFRETHPEIDDVDDSYDEYGEANGESEAEMEGKHEHENLPPYVKKFNRRNKHLLNLLESPEPSSSSTHLSSLASPPSARRTMWSGSMLQPGPHEHAVRIDDEHVKAWRSHRSRNKADLFAKQRPAPTSTIAPAATPSPPPTDRNALTITPTGTGGGEEVMSSGDNQLPDEDISISFEDNSDDIWQKEIESKSNANDKMTGSAQMAWQIEKLTTDQATDEGDALGIGLAVESTTITTVTPKPALFKVPSYPAIAGTFMSKPRSRSSQFIPNPSSGRGNSFISSAAGSYAFAGVGAGPAGGSKTISYFPSFNIEKSRPSSALHSSTEAPHLDATTTSAAATPRVAAAPSRNRGITSFVYHRVVDASPRLVGAGSTGRKQRLPFVAITDRRLETSKKAQIERQKDIEQNHFPMP